MAGDAIRASKEHEVHEPVELHVVDDSEHTSAHNRSVEDCERDHRRTSPRRRRQGAP